MAVIHDCIKMNRKTFSDRHALEPGMVFKDPSDGEMFAILNVIFLESYASIAILYDDGSTTGFMVTLLSLWLFVDGWAQDFVRIC